MNQEIFCSKYAVVSYDAQTEIFIVRYLSGTANMTDSEWQELMHEILKLSNKYKPKFIIDDNSERLYSYPPDMQVWTLNLFVNNWNKNGLKKYVQIIPKDIIGHLTADQIIELAHNEYFPRFKSNSVVDYQRAITWIME